MKLPTIPAHETADEYMTDHPEATVKLLEALASNELPPAYHEHPLVVAHTDELIMPWGLYMDSVPHSLVDSVLGVWLINLITGWRSMLCLVRKRVVCSCSCRGWCTYYHLMIWLRWAFDAMADSTWPTSRHDGQPWADGRDTLRSALAGTRIKFRASS